MITQALRLLVSRPIARLAFALALHGLTLAASAQGTAFTYQGRLLDNGAPANGLYDLRFELRDALVAGNPVGLALTNAPVAVSNGVFTVTLDFGAGMFTGAARFLEIGVRTNTSVLAHTLLIPRQALTAVPYAIRAAESGSAVTVSGTLAASQITGPLTAAQLPGTAARTDQANTFTGNQTVTGDMNAARLSVGVGHSLTGSISSTIAGGENNQIINAILSIIGGGFQNTIQPLSFASTIGGGINNTIQTNASSSTIGGGSGNVIQRADFGGGTIGGGSGNTIQSNAFNSTIGGGGGNTIQTNGNFATIPGGDRNAATNHAFAAGTRAKADHTGAFVWADNTEADFASTATNQFNVRASGGARFELGSGSFLINGQPVFTGANAAGLTNLTAASLTGTLPGAQLVGTYPGAVTLNNAANSFSGSYSGNGSGLTGLWKLGGNAGTTPGTHFLGTTDNQALEFKVNNARGLRLELSTNRGPNEIGINVIGGAPANFVGDGIIGATIGGGGSVNYFGTVFSNSVMSVFATIGGGSINMIRENAFDATIGGGGFNLIEPGAFWSTIGGGTRNTNYTNASYATIPGGDRNAATNHAFAAGTRAKADHTGAFVWADSTEADIASAANDSVTMRAAGGYRLFSDSLSTKGVSLAAGGTAWATLSDRDAKKDFAPVDGMAVLEKLAAVPVLSWRYKAEAADSVPHLGPVAQDFKAAFFPGRDDKSISTLEFDGVELAAIQGLHQMVKQQDTALKQQDTALKAKDVQIATLEQRMADLEKLVRTLAK